MTKNRSRMLIIFLSLLLIIGLVASFVSFKYPLSIGGVYYRYSSFTNEIVLGSDIGEGVLFEYTAKIRDGYDDQDCYDDLMQNTVSGLKDILEDSGFKNSTIVRNGTDGIRVEVGGIVDRDDQSEVITLIGSPAELVLSSSTDPDDAFLSSDVIKSVKAKSVANGSTTVFYVEITFAKDKLEQVKTATADAVSDSGSFYMLLGETQIGSSSEAVTTESITMTSDNFIDMKTTESYAIRMRTGLLPLELTCSYSGAISAAAGFGGTISNSHGFNPMIYIWIVLAIMVVASFVFFAIRYKQLGLMAIFNMLFYIVLGLFFIQSVPLVHVNLSGIFAIVLGYVLAVVCLVTTLENARNEYAKGKKLHTCLHQGINSSITSNLTVNIMMVLAGIVCALMPNMAIQSFGLVSMVLGFVNAFCSQVWMRVMINLYLPFNSEDGSKCNFTKEGLKDVK